MFAIQSLSYPLEAIKSGQPQLQEAGAAEAGWCCSDACASASPMTAQGDDRRAGCLWVTVRGRHAPLHEAHDGKRVQHHGLRQRLARQSILLFFFVLPAPAAAVIAVAASSPGAGKGGAEAGGALLRALPARKRQRKRVVGQAGQARARPLRRQPLHKKVIIVGIKLAGSTSTCPLQIDSMLKLCQRAMTARHARPTPCQLLHAHGHHDKPR